jgi:undecaprenyl-diphosphatase
VDKDSNRRYIVLILVLAVFSLFVSLEAHWHPIFPGDLAVLLWIQSFSNPALTLIMSWTSFLFTRWPAALMVAVAGIIMWRRLGKVAGIGIWIIGPLSLINDLFKLAIGRPRPSTDQVQLPDTNLLGINHSFGYPSGHTFFAILLLGFLAYLLFQNVRGSRWRMFTIILSLMIILMVSISRIYLGVHWPSDVLGGYILGGFFLVLLIWGYRKVSKIPSGRL